jgi:hypothetical protein
MDVLELTVTEVPGFVPKLTVVAPVNPLPVKVTTLVPVTGPELGETPLTVGAGAKYVKVSELEVGLSPADVVTCTFTVPVPAGATAVIEVPEFTVNDVAGVAPKDTADAPVKASPVMVTEVPPAAGPVAGDTSVTSGP